jgi:putative glycosyltransferase (TIGR04372 family)
MQSLLSTKDLGNTSVISKLKLEKGLYVVFHSRDDLYLQNFKLEDGNNHSYRNFNFANFNSSMDYLRSKNIKAVRIGKVSEQDFNKNEYLNLSNTKFNDELRLISESKFFVSGNTGIAQISTLLRKPQLYVNYLPLRLDHLASMAPNSIVIPKYIFKHDLGRLNLRELFRVSEDWSIHDFDYIKNQKLTIENNSESDILFAIQQMQNSLERFKENTIRDQSESIYKYIVDLTSDKDFANYVFFELKIRFSNKFLKQHL